MDQEYIGATVNVSEKEASELQQSFKKFEGMFAEAQANFQSSTFATYYIVSAKFINQWRDFCLSNDITRTEPIPMNIDLIDPATQQLKPGLVQSEDFELINSQIYTLFGKYKAKQSNTLKRISYQLNNEKKVPIYLSTILFIVLKQSDLENIDRRRTKKQDLKFSELKTLSRNNTIGDFLYSVNQQESIPHRYYLRGWVNKGQFTLGQLYSYIAKQTQPLSYWDMKIKGVGKLLDQQNKSFNDIGFEDNDYIIVQCAQGEKWFLRSQDQSKCQGCFKIKKLTHICGCKKVGYCSVSCQQKDIQYHAKYCSFMQQQELNKKIQMTMKPSSSKGLVGLTNLGNTCFMNSCLQCLSNTMPLTDYFLSGAFEEQINKENPLGTKGKLAKSYATFIKNMWCEQARTYSPYRLKAAVASINQMFSGYAQHDSQQFFSFLVDGLHEDLNRVLKKPYVESVDSKGRPDNIVAFQSWLAHTQRNQSIIVDMMTGQYKSKVICPDCKKQSITFDPFITVTLPIPQEGQINQLVYYVLSADNLHQTKKMSIIYQKPNPEVWLEDATALLKSQKSSYKFYVMTFSENIYSFQGTPKNQLLYKIQTQRKSVFLLELTPQQQQLQNQLELVFRLSKKIYGDTWDSLWFKRPFWFKKGTTTGLVILKRILKYLYHDTYDDSIKRHYGQGSGKTYEQYEELMLKQRPFTIYLRYQKQIERHYSRVEVNFEKQVQIQDDKNVEDLLKELSITDLNNIEIDIRFSKFALQEFSPDRLKKYTEGQRQKKTDYYEQKKSVTLDKCFQIFEEPEQLEKGNQWYCSNCKDHKLATKQLTIYKAPEILILHLKRFKSKGIIRKQKNDTKVQFPQILDMKQYVIDPTPITTYIPEVQKAEKYIAPKYDNQLLELNQTQPKYQLYAISNHYGGLGGGHYTAYCKNNGNWYSFNDSSVSQVDQHAIKGSGAYILFYKRIR